MFRFSSNATLVKIIRGHVLDAEKWALPVSSPIASRRVKEKRGHSRPFHAVPSLNQTCSKTELARENAKLHEQLRNKQWTPEKTAIQIAIPSLQASRDVPPRPRSNSLSHGDQDCRMSEISSHGDPDAAKSINLQEVPTGTYGFQTAAPTLTIDQLGRRKVNDCFAMYVRLP